MRDWGGETLMPLPEIASLLTPAVALMAWVVWRPRWWEGGSRTWVGCPGCDGRLGDPYSGTPCDLCDGTGPAR